MTESLNFPVTTPPEPGETIPIAPGVYWLRMRLPFALNHINLWLLEDGAGWTIVDCGFALPETKEAWERIFAEQLGGRPVRRIIVTHFHPDHMGLADWLAARWQAPVWTTEKEYLHARMMSGDVGEASANARRDFARRAGLDEEMCGHFAERQGNYRRGCPSVPPVYHRIGDGSVIEIGGRAWRVIIGEGHAPEHACLYCADAGVLIAGDQILPRISPNISVQPFEPQGDPLARYLRSLDKIRAALPPDILVLPSHNLPFYGVHQRIDELASHHHARCDDVIAACDRPKTAADLLPVLFRRQLDRHQMGFALGEALAHLHYLVGHGTIERSDECGDGVDRFRRKAA
ncbi:MAG TPA: MBL fold metallo-hydrolase [Stellaceae bacterium]|jgi:glyoxylase-like metal-dependent hydrolase (beta-lactamase superfamily II)|nr:MBL fold metallo-hydrolase [Stellaceae bacterium]